MSITPPRLVGVERVDDLPVLFAALQRLRLAECVDRHFPPHHRWEGELSRGEVVSVWLAFLTSQGDHRLSQLQPWAQQHRHTLQACLGKPVRALDFHDDRLADLLDALAQEQPWRELEADLNRHTLRVYDLPDDLVRLDATTASSYADVLSEHGLLQFGHSKDRDDLPQLKVFAAALDPLGMPLSTAVVAGHRADDPLYVPAIRQVQAALGQGGRTYVGDCKMAALATRAYLASTGDYYLCPLSEVQLPPEERRRLLEPAWQGQQSLERVCRPAAQPDRPDELVAEGFAVEVPLQAEVGERLVSWTERRWLVRSAALARAQQQRLQERLGRAQAELDRLNERKQGKKRLDAEPLAAAAQAVVGKHRVEGLLVWQVQTSTHERTVRRYGSRPEQVVVEQERRLEWSRQEGAIAQAQRELGWQVYANNRAGLSLAQVVWGYRGQYHIEKDWSRLKGRPLSLTPLYLQTESRIEGLVLLLSLALRLLTLLEWGVRRKLHESGEKLRGLYPGQPGRQTGRPSAELLLGALGGPSLVVEEVAGGVRLRLTPLSPLQQRLLELWDLPADLYQRLTLHCPEPPPSLSER